MCFFTKDLNESQRQNLTKLNRFNYIQTLIQRHQNTKIKAPILKAANRIQIQRKTLWEIETS